jgi:hypothetical protein
MWGISVIAKLLVAVALALGLTAAGSACADQTASCYENSFPEQIHDFRAAKLTGKSLLIDGFQAPADCANSNAKSCRNTALRRGTAIIISFSYTDFFCAYIPGINKGGWIKTDVVRQASQRLFANSTWLGTWSDYNDHLKIRSAPGGKVHVSGDAIWYGNIVDSTGYRSEHYGQVNFSAHPKNGVLKLVPEDQYDCGIELIHVGDFLIARDNQNCGGSNVSFTGVYTRKRR